MSVVLRFFYHGSRLLLGALFLYAGALKATDVAAFAGSVASYQILPYAWNILLAAILPYVEILVGVLLLANTRVRASALLSGVLSGIFLAALGSALARGLKIDCGCFRPESHSPLWLAIARDVGILLLAALTYRLRGRKTREIAR